MKTLYFEGAGWSDADISRATIGNCRIRTAFYLDDGRPVYLEMSGTECPIKSASPELFRWPYAGFVTDCFYITDDVPNDDCNWHRIPNSAFPRSFEWSEAGILEVVNGLGASFDAVKVVPDYGGYQVFKIDRASGGGTLAYNYGDKFQYNEGLTARRAAKVAEMKKLNESRFHMRHDNSSYYLRKGELIMWLCVSEKQLSEAGLSEREFVLEV